MDIVIGMEAAVKNAKTLQESNVASVATQGEVLKLILSKTKCE